jgi:hypothetical protein
MPFFFENVAGPQGASYAAPLMDFGKQISDLPEAYFKSGSRRS